MLRSAGRYDANTGGVSREAHVYINLSDEGRTHKCSPEFVNDLCDRIMPPAVEELNRRLGQGWAREIEPWLVLEGPALTFKILLVKLDGLELIDMSTLVNEVFNEYWEREIDRIPPE
ncbi:hypothetical protein E1287_16435 [Actinomadura sp. KC06]|uniref:hypothetical protein n=1 Tax=Actinomadura sp. KC06 TaxID=2530369 RepID=UPI00104DE46B|nr:hypothetical protein [Actinomadura sp. KC06]TDD34480.1 hypothetical protein E1287_16435 [Actinomadura sp. KC06]